LFPKRDNTTSSSNAGRYNTGLGGATSQAFRRYNNPLSMFAENFLDRLPGVGGGLGRIVKNMAFTATTFAKGKEKIIPFPAARAKFSHQQ
jgi:hypothetical protein